MKCKIPEGWKKSYLGDLSHVKGGKRLPKGEQLIKHQNSHPYIKVKNMHGAKTIQLDKSFEYVPEKIFEAISKYTVKTNDIILSIVGTIGLVSIIGESLEGANLTENCIRLYKLEGITKNYLYYYLTSKNGQNEISKGTVGSTQPKLPIYNIKKIKVLLPVIKEQNKISDILSSLDDKIENNNAIIANLEAQAQAIFKSWFIDFEPFQDGEFVDSELGKIPKGWEVKKIADVTNSLLGGTPARKNKEYWNGNIPWINSSKVNKLRIIEPSEYITKAGLKNSSTKLLPKKTTVVAITGATLGQVSLLEIDSCANQSVIGILENEDIPYEYIYPFFLQNIEKIILKQTGSSQQHINNNDIKNTKILIPKKIIMDSYKKITFEIYKLVENYSFQNQTLAELRDTLLPKLMSGEIRVGDVDLEEIEE